ncbi:MAG: glycosyltransferase [Bacteroidales bacterium]|jgi:glycosyltransferase involved in cell wall biosynthesis|nr:glycosyltransferase [Bacteroidales bacterium]MDD2687753.1 glycosyltransferase [Bacteroidales bacterium]MDD3331419.1 glycosyltransferase [Bacteroidales bacterium]MDD3692038.1 glycosyltransferase [Bacteroidales bacterium]MDD4045443.1 glycosyltransferase [Bacteroidales bacterium]
MFALAMILILSFFLFIQLVYYWIVFARFAFRRPKTTYADMDDGVSVIICAKNELHWLKRYLRPLLEQDYPNYEVIVVNDNSDDGTDSFLKEYQSQYPHLHPVSISTNQVRVMEKKMALAVGIKSAKHEIVLITDVDSAPKSPNWIYEMVKHYNTDTYIVLGYGSYEPKKGLLNTLIRYDSLHVATQYFSYALMGYPYRGVSRNLSFPKSLFLSNYNYVLSYNTYVSDDDLFVNQIANKKNTAIEYNPQAHIVTQQRQHTFADWLLYKQHCKHTGKYYKFKNRLALFLYAASGFMFYCSLILALFLCINNTKYLYIIAALFTLRLISQYIVFGKIIHTLEEKSLKGILPFLDLFFMLFLPILQVHTLFYTPKKWK